jgi:hypothetical protein
MAADRLLVHVKGTALQEFSDGSVSYFAFLTEKKKGILIALTHNPIKKKALSRPRYGCLSAFEKLRKATISFVVFGCPSVRPHGTTRFPPDPQEFLYLSFSPQN